jgi:hypothetical protein
VINFNDSDSQKSVYFTLDDLEYVFHRSFLHVDNGLEFYLWSKRSYFVCFPKGDRQQLLQLLKKRTLPGLKIRQTGPSHELVPPITEKWRNRITSI